MTREVPRNQIGACNEPTGARVAGLADFMAACNFVHRLKIISGRAPYDYILKIWSSERERFIFKPIHELPELIA